MEHPIVNPPNPFVGTLRVFPGTLVKVAGRPRPGANRFAINFQTGPSLNPRDDLALHLSPCFAPPRIVRNSLRNSVWGLEEAWPNGANTMLAPGQPFEIMVLAEEDQYKIAVNGVHYCEFRHRMPYGEVTHLSIDGDVDIERISITSTGPYQQPQPQPQPQSAPAMPPYPVPGAPSAAMPTPSLYPSLSGSSYPPAPSGGMPMPGAYPTAAAPSAGPAPYPQAPGGAYPGAYPPPTMGPGGYPQAQPPYMQGGPGPAYPQQAPMPGYQQGYPGQQHPHQPHGHSSGPFGNLPGGKTLGTLAGLGLGAAAGAAVLSAVNPLKHVKKALKPKGFKHGWGGRSSSSSNSSLSSFSSNSS